MDISFSDLRKKINCFSNKNNFIAFFQVVSTFILYFCSWFFYFSPIVIFRSYLIPFVLVFIILLNCRLFVLMHDTGHAALFNGSFLNKFIGFFIGVLVGVPCYPWARDHAFHHKTNGDWESYPGTLEVITVKKYRALSSRQKKLYRLSKSVWLAPIVGFIYLVFNPRFIYLFHVVSYVEFQIKKRCFGYELKSPRPAPVWPKTLTRKEFVHMTLHNIFFVALVAIFSFKLGLARFFLPFCFTLSLSGAIIFLIFISQHNFENSYAASKENSDLLKGCLHGTAFLVLPRLLNFFTADIGYHHVHHISAKIPNYRLRECHEALSPYFEDVYRMSMTEILKSPQYSLWDVENECLVTCSHFDKFLSNVSNVTA